ncbi:MAG: DUF3991 and toprim domain-containing protein [Lachnospirales bacterium]
MSVKYSKEEYNIAKNVSCFTYLTAKGYEVEKHGQHHKLKEHDSLVLFNDGKFKWYSKDLYGNAITLLKELEYKPLNIAIKELAQFAGGINNVRSPTHSKSKNKTEVQKEEQEQSQEQKQPEKVSKLDTEFTLPKRNTSTDKVRKYLIEIRGLSKEVVDYAIANNLVYQDVKGNCIFVGYDANKKPKFATLRGTYEKKFRQDIKGSNKTCGFSIVNKNSKNLYIFESAIDSLSMMSLIGMKNSANNNFLALNGTSIKTLENFLNNNPNIDTIITCLDNDEAGRKATKKIWEIYKKTHKMKYYRLSAKDINEHLIQKNKTGNLPINNKEVSKNNTPKATKQYRNNTEIER